MVTDNAKAMVMASFVADAFSLGPHWIYDQDKIARKFGTIDKLTAPLPDSFHPTKSAGDFTHYGDQTLVLLESIARQGAFDLRVFADLWQTLFADYQGYVDKATQTTLNNLSKNGDPRASGSSSTDLGGAARIAPLVYRYHRNEAELFDNIKAQTAMTHRNDLVMECAVFLAMVAVKALDGTDPVTAVTQITEAFFDTSPLSMLVQKGLASRNQNTRKTIADFGQMCDSNAAFPGVIHLVGTFPENLSAALVENAMAGGDSAARGMMTGMILGAYQGIQTIPAHWLDQMKRRSRIEQLLSQIDSDG